jgi:hypothetical protein
VDDWRPVARQYSYALQEGEETLATGWLTSDEEMEAGDHVTIAGIAARVAEVAWTNGGVHLLLTPRRLSA